MGIILSFMTPYYMELLPRQGEGEYKRQVTPRIKYIVRKMPITRGDKVTTGHTLRQLPRAFRKMFWGHLPFLPHYRWIYCENKHCGAKVFPMSGPDDTLCPACTRHRACREMIMGNDISVFERMMKANLMELFHGKLTDCKTKRDILVAIRFVKGIDATGMGINLLTDEFRKGLRPVLGNINT